MSKTIDELRDYLLENYVDELGNLDLMGLDFSEFDGDVYISDMKVKGNLNQGGHIVQGNLYQRRQKVQGDLDEVGHIVQGNLFHGSSGYGGELFEYSYSKLIKEITLEELAELGYKLKEEVE